MRENGLNANERVYMISFSSAGFFAHRFTMLHPDRVKAMWLGGEGPASLPASELDGQPLNYPLGMRNIETLAGEPFDFDTYRRIPHFVCSGERDVDSRYTDIFTRSEWNIIESHFGSTYPEWRRFFFEYLVGVPAEFRLYEDIGHEITDQMMHDAFDFLIRSS